MCGTANRGPREALRRRGGCSAAWPVLKYGTMKPSADPRGATLLRQIPSVDELLSRPGFARLCEQLPRATVVEMARAVLADLRALIVRDPEAAAAALDPASLAEHVAAEVHRALGFSLRPVINATGVVLHTNLGRAPLAPQAIEHLRSAATQYANLEYDLAVGTRGRRDVHTARLLARLVGAEAAIVVNNNAAAVFLVLNALAKGGEVIVSRGELIEIGDAFRIPDIMAESGAILREVGTTNRTRLADYERAITDRTRLLLRVHPSNFRIVGFTERPSLEELVELGRRVSLPVFEDLGSGCLVDLSAYGIEEPIVRASLTAGVSVVSFSGDKLLGGPQAGIIAGKKELVERIRRDPLFRALRVDKLTIAALEATQLAYLRGALDEIPTLRMIRMSAEEIERRAKAFVAGLSRQLPSSEVEIQMRSGESVIGGGSTPAQHLATALVTISSVRYSAAQLEARLRQPAAGEPVLARIENETLVIDLRTVFPEQEPALAAALAAALH
jgi:L-seryl-tRNA(Ser) seleniumtransferase